MAGLSFLFAPGLVHFVDISAETPTARSDVRALFGGLELGIAAALALCARRPEWHRVGLLLQAFAFGGLALGRLTSLLLDGMPRMISVVLLAAELLGVVVALIALRAR
jgi:hypothetical protein